MIFLTNFFKNSITVCDAPINWQFGMQEPASPSAEGIIFFNEYLMFFIILICCLVFFMLFIIISYYNNTKQKTPELFSHSSLLEIVWTLFPAVILIFLAIPSFALLYSLDEVIDPDVTLKIIGHQWYWSYEYSDFSISTSFSHLLKQHQINLDSEALSTLSGNKYLEYDSYMVPTNELTPGAFRLLEVDNRVVLPTLTHIRLLVTAADVIHSWAVPSLGIKVDACPGRLTQASLFIKREGLFFGQCSEICGINHGFMPIAVKSVNADSFEKWLEKKFDFASVLWAVQK